MYDAEPVPVPMGTLDLLLEVTFFSTALNVHPEHLIHLKLSQENVPSINICENNKDPVTFLIFFTVILACMGE